jgi:hypothetical protein
LPVTCLDDALEGKYSIKQEDFNLPVTCLDAALEGKSPIIQGILTCRQLAWTLF